MIAGICPARRRRRLAPFPSSLRLDADSLCSVAIAWFLASVMKPHRCGGCAPPRPGEPGWHAAGAATRLFASIHVQAADRFAEGDAADGFGQQLGDAELADP